MTHRERVDHFVAEMRKRGVGSSTSAPPFYRLLWFLGVEVPPPHFQKSGSMALLTGSLFGVLFGGLMYYWSLWQSMLIMEVGPLLGDQRPAASRWQSMVIISIGVACITALLSGALFGVLLSAYYKWSAKRLKLPPWDQYPQG